MVSTYTDMVDVLSAMYLNTHSYHIFYIIYVCDKCIHIWLMTLLCFNYIGVSSYHGNFSD